MIGVRFAPSPTGRFHVGNLRTAWISHRWARQLGQPWIVRFEDIDRPRVVVGARESQLADMKALGLVPDQIVVQSERHERHFSLFEKARLSGSIYPCFCSRKEIQDALISLASAPHGDRQAVYNGHCRTRTATAASRGHLSPNLTIAWRLRSAAPSGADDFIVARTSTHHAIHSGDFVPGYHWACAIDDYDGDYALLVRAWDLAPAAAQQKKIFEWIARLEKPRDYPAVFHTSLVTRDDGRRLEKRTAGVTWDELAAAGWTANSLTELFSGGYEPNGEHPAPGHLFGESRKTISLAQLGISSETPTR